ncbi:MAG: efflux RND transporter permease subunit [Pseudomonadota bacterium]
MNLNVSAWSIRRPVPSLVLFMVVMALGIMSFRSLPVTRFPNIDIPVIQVLVTQSGAAPSELETQVAKEIENAVAGINGVKHITSTLTEGAATTLVEFRLEIDQDRALNDVKDAVARIRQDLPRTIDEPIIQRIEIEGLPIVTYAARAPAMTPEELSWFVDDTIKRTIQGVKGVSDVSRIGGVTREIRIALDPDRLLALGITAGDVNTQLRATNIDLAGGRGEIAGREQAIRTLAGKKTVEDLAGTAISLPSGRKIRLDQLGTVTDAVEEPRTFATLDNNSVVAFSISRSKGASETTVAERVAEKIVELEQRYPDVKLTRIDTTVEYTFGVYESTMKTLLEGAALAIVVVFVFLRDWRATVIAAVALPLSIIPAFWAMSVLGFSLNLVSLLAVTIVTGILVDDAIVEIENIVRHTRMGKSAYRASLEAADEIGLAVIAITATIIAVFVPVSFMGGIAGQYFKQFGLTVAFAVFFSLLVARLITPMLAAYFMREAPHEEKEGPVIRAYSKLVSWSVHHRIVTVLMGLVIFAGSIGSFYLLPSGFIPREDISRALLSVELPPGSPMAETRTVTTRITNMVKAIPEVQSVFVNGGTSFGGGGGGPPTPGAAGQVNKATIIINLTPKKERARPQYEIEEEITRRVSQIPDIRTHFLGDNGQRPFQLVVIGRDGDEVEQVAAGMTAQAKTLPLLTNVESTAKLDRPELRVYPRTDIAAELGVTTQAISEAVRIATIGDIGANLAKFDVGDRQVPIRVQLAEDARTQLDLMTSLKVRTRDGHAVPLTTVATFKLDQGPTSITRYDRERQILIGAGLVGNTPLGDAVNAVMALPAAKDLPPGVTVRQFGDAEIMVEVFEGFGKAMAAGLMMVYAVLVLLFASFLQPITILFSLPLSIGGAIIALAITGNPISLPVVIGILMLMGIVTKNAIMLVDFAIEEIARGVDRLEAIIDAGRKRARPIVMTTIAMSGGMLPSALALDSGGEFRAPMAIAVIGGLISSTLLSLIFVPAVFVLIDDFGQVFWRGVKGFVGKTDEPEDPAQIGTGEVTPGKAATGQIPPSHPAPAE